MKKTVFISYSHSDEPLKEELESHLAALKRENLIDVWHDRKLVPGQLLDQSIEERLASADLIILLVSAPFINSDYCTEKEMTIAFDRAKRGETIVVSVIARPCQWAAIPLRTGDKLGDFLALPKDAVPVTTFVNRDVAWNYIVTQIRELLTAAPPVDRTENIEQVLASNIAAATKGLSDFSEQDLPGTKSIAGHLAAAIDKLTKEEDFPNRVFYGFKDLDHVTGGLRENEVTLVAATPMVEKTAFVTSVSSNIADGVRTRKGDLWIAYFSLGVAAETVSYRMIAQRTGLPLWKMRNGKFTESEWEKFVLAIEDVSSAPLILTDNIESWFELEAAIRTLYQQHQALVVVIDDLQRIHAPRLDNGKDLSNVAKSIKALAIELNVPFILSVDLPIDVSSRHDKQLGIADIKVFGSMADHIDTIMLLHREAPYLAQEEPEPGTFEHARWMEKLERVYDRAEIIAIQPALDARHFVWLAFDQAKRHFTDATPLEHTSDPSREG